MEFKEAIFVESLVAVDCEESREVAENIIELIDGEELETLKEIEKLLLYYTKAKAQEDTIHRSLSSILYKNNEKSTSE